MNKKEEMIYKVLDLVIKECQITNVGEISRDDVLGKNKKENVCMTRCIFATMLAFMGYSNTTIATMLGRTEQSVSDIFNAAHQYRIKSWAYRIAEAECTLGCRTIMSE